jgi:hypothetical protein
MASNSIKFHIERRLSVLFVSVPIDLPQKSTAQNPCTISEFKETGYLIGTRQRASYIRRPYFYSNLGLL